MHIFTLEGEQRDAFETVCAHLISRGTNVLRLNGPAGTGKTYVMRNVIKFMKLHGKVISVVAFTGRAASQLGKDGISAGTCHALLYTPIFDDEKNLIGWDKKTNDEIREACADGLILDEASMLPKEMHNIFMSLGVPIVYAGDQAQLPSVNTDRNAPEFNAMVDVAGPVCSLTKNRRFSENNGIGFLASHLRENDSFPRVKKEALTYRNKADVLRLDFHKKNQYDVVVCGMNKTRKRFNDLIRRARGFHGELPEIGETVVCLQNTIVNGGEARINNGERFTVVGSFPGKVLSTFILNKEGEDDGKQYIVNVANDCWVSEYSEKSIGNTVLCKFGYGYCMSCHKVQGSTFSSVLFYDEDVSFFLERKKFRYTAVTRAATQLDVAI